MIARGIDKSFASLSFNYFIPITVLFCATFVLATNINLVSDNNRDGNNDTRAPPSPPLPLPPRLTVTDNERKSNIEYYLRDIDDTIGDQNVETNYDRSNETSISSLRYESSKEKYFRPGRRRRIDIVDDKEYDNGSFDATNDLLSSKNVEIIDDRRITVDDEELGDENSAGSIDEKIGNEEEREKEKEKEKVEEESEYRYLITTNKRGFSFTDIVETIFSFVTTGITTIVNNIVGKESNNNYKNRPNRVNYKGHQMLRITPTSDRQVTDLKEMIDDNDDAVKFWTIPMKNRSTDVIVAPGVLDDIKDFLREEKFGYKVMINDIQKTISHENPKMSKEQREDLVTSKGHSMTWKRYHRYADIIRYLEYLSFAYPNIVELVTIGHSYEGQPIKLAKVSTGPTKDGENKPIVWIDGGMHAREWIGPAVATYILNQLVEKNVTYTKLLDISDWMILPVSNPDGYEFSHTSDRLWRKTRSNHASPDSDNEARSGPLGLFHLVSHYTRWFFYRCEGVDPNRNFGFHWGEEKEGAASSDPCHETYAGPKAFSEPETQAIADYILAHKQNIKMYLTLHAYSQMWLVPWGYTKVPPNDFDELMNVARKATNAINKVHGTQYQVGASPELLYPTSGGSDDWAKGVAGIKYSYTLELRDRGAYGFLLPAREIVPTARETWAGIRAITRLVTCNT